MASTTTTNQHENETLKSFRRRQHKEEMKHQLVSFILMIILTIVSFIAVAYEEFSRSFVVPFILLLAIVQVAYQLYYFMHMKNKGHQIASFFLYSGVFVAALTILAMMALVTWS
ncbi:cytochrome c oxidase subunit IVB [Bacillaceae bacterium SIJ1]|uniref:cytochrome c oxidase subunit IVB n=1 Tax=Litoribacterium kuwaitense TaxID=1398745 RepID=UPI0013EE13EF|nr:cytochrome c oxidase subunit IVB [Litoribacterium kuwaitense]NGP44375.1 cytochrome c oxidase subunit IVB [Litoribacterium kuwaitense]